MWTETLLIMSSIECNSSPPHPSGHRLRRVLVNNYVLPWSQKKSFSLPYFLLKKLRKREWKSVAIKTARNWKVIHVYLVFVPHYLIVVMIGKYCYYSNFVTLRDNDSKIVFKSCTFPYNKSRIRGNLVLQTFLFSASPADFPLFSTLSDMFVLWTVSSMTSSKAQELHWKVIPYC